MRVGIDIGGTNTDVVCVDSAGAVLARHRVPTGYGAAEVVRSALGAVHTAVALAGGTVGEVESFGAGTPGIVRDGRVAHAMNLGLVELDLAGELSAALGKPVVVDNDVNAAALGVWQEKGIANDSLAYLNLGTGLAAGLVLEGRLWRGARGAAGELGHILIDPSGPVGPNGQRGGLETLASGSGLASQWQTDDAVPALFAAADAGDERARRIRDGLFEGVAVAVRILVLTVDVDRVVIGGGLTNLGDRLLDGVQAVFARWDAADSPFVASLKLADRVELAAPDIPYAALGAALLGADVAGTEPSRWR